MKNIISSALTKSMTYLAYRKMTQQLLAENKTTGPNQSEEIVHYTKLNEQRMGRIDKTITLEEHTKAFFGKLKGQYTWLVISEPWCGDASHIVPLFEKIASVSKAIDLQIVLRDENPKLMDAFEQNGSRAIPVLIMLDATSQKVLGSWGARPAPAQQLVIEYKAADPKPSYEELKINLQKWYNKDKALTLQKELVEFTTKAIKTLEA